MSEMPSSLYFRQIASACETNSAAFPIRPNPKTTATICFMRCVSCCDGLERSQDCSRHHGQTRQCHRDLLGRIVVVLEHARLVVDVRLHVEVAMAGEDEENRGRRSFFLCPQSFVDRSGDSA